MKKISLIAVIVLAALLLTLLPGCIRIDIGDDSGPTTTKTYDFTGFTGIETGNAFKIDVTRSENYSIKITISEKIANRLNVIKIGDTLHIDLKEPTLTFHGRPTATITLPDLRSLDLSGASQGNVKGFKSANSFNLEISGASNLDIDMETGNFKAGISGASKVNGYLKAASSDIEISGASRISLSGSGGDTALEISGASQAGLENYPIANANIKVSGAGQASVFVNGKLDAELSGASRLEYGGKPVLGKVEVTGGSTLKQK